MPASAPFPSPSPNTAQPASSNVLYPALYLYPLNDTWTPKHIILNNQHTKIGRQTSSKTAPGERNGFFDSKVLSRQHAEVWEDNAKIYIKDVRSSNGTFINGERLSSESQESEPFELKSDDIVEFGIDIVGEDNKTIIHHKVAARVVCVFNEQDAQVAARAEQHQQQQQQQQQHFLQHQSSSSPSTSLPPVNGAASHANSVAGTPGGPQNFPFAAQRRAQLAQQGLGGMGAMRPPGKTGLSFDVILSRLQGELQKSRETGAELNSLTGSMGEIHDTLGGNMPTNIPLIPSRLPPVRSQDASVSNPAGPSSSSPLPPLPPAVGASDSPSAHQSPPPSNAPPPSVQDLQVQVRDTQSSLQSHLDRVRMLEEAFAEQEVLKRDVKSLKDEMEARKLPNAGDKIGQEPERRHHHHHHHQRERIFGNDHHGRRLGGYSIGGGGFDLEDDEVALHDVFYDDDDTRSIATAIPHELERVDEEDEDQLVSEHEDQFDEPESVQPLEDAARFMLPKDNLTSRSAATIIANGDPELRHENTPDEERGFSVDRPRTPEPRLSLLATAARPRNNAQTEAAAAASADLQAQILELSKRIAEILQQTSTLEARYSKAQEDIGGLQNKVGDLETMLDVARKELEEAHANLQKEAEAQEVELEEEKVVSEAAEEKRYASLVEAMTDWKKSVEGQWGSVREEWTQERDRLSKARDEFESRVRQVDDKVVTLQTTLMGQQEQMQTQIQQQQQQLLTLSNASSSSHPFLHHLNGDAVKHNSGLVTPPSPRSQSSDSVRYRRRRRRSYGGSRVRSRSCSGGRVLDKNSAELEEGVLDDEDDDDADTGSRTTTTTTTTVQPCTSQTQLATPASSVGSLDGEVNSSSSSRCLSKAAGGDAIRSSSPPPSMTMMHSTTFDEESEETAAMNHPEATSSSSSSSSSSSLSPSKSSSSSDPRSHEAMSAVHLQTAAGVVLLSIAAAAVFWKVKPE